MEFHRFLFFFLPPLLPILAGGVLGCCWDGVKGGRETDSFSGDVIGVETLPLEVGAKFSLFATGGLALAGVSVIEGAEGALGVGAAI